MITRCRALNEVLADIRYTPDGWSVALVVVVVDYTVDRVVEIGFAEGQTDDVACSIYVGICSNICGVIGFRGVGRCVASDAL